MYCQKNSMHRVSHIEMRMQSLIQLPKWRSVCQSTSPESGAASREKVSAGAWWSKASQSTRSPDVKNPRHRSSESFISTGIDIPRQAHCKRTLVKISSWVLLKEFFGFPKPLAAWNETASPAPMSKSWMRHKSEIKLCRETAVTH